MTIFIGCSSSNEVNELYKKEAEKLAKLLCDYNCTLLFGSSQSGLMGIIYKTFKKNKCKVISVMPIENYGELVEVDSDEKVYVKQTSDQLKYLVNNGDMTIIMPGGFGTLSELMTSIQCKKMGENNKKIIILNMNGFYSEILNKFKTLNEEKFELSNQNNLYEVIDTYKDIEKYLTEKNN